MRRRIVVVPHAEKDLRFSFEIAILMYNRLASRHGAPPDMSYRFSADHALQDSRSGSDWFVFLNCQVGTRT